MERIWYYANGAERRGPHTDSELRALLAQGSLTPATLVWSEGLADWIPLSASELAPASTSVLPGPPPQASVSPVTSSVPDGLRGWMQFCGVMMIVGGAMQSLSCIGAIFGIPMIIAGVAFTGAASQLEKLGAVDANVAALLGRLRSGFKAAGIGIIISLVLTLILLSFYLVLGVALLKAFSTSLGATP